MALLALASPPARAVDGPDVGAPFAIRDARLVTVSGATLDRGTIVVDRGLIAAIGADVEPPAGAWIIEGAGLTVYPGLIDGLASLPLVMPPVPTGN
ncbi:MAG TPA: hypothetical protein VHR17_00210, partial [Thermoanaerobaculia bacterium]|nr:hypothetical protein [Thermoanaerobaculia bacterium]